MIATHLIKVNGKWYQPGEKILADATPKTYNKKDISFMNKGDLKALAAELGLDIEGFNANEIKKVIIEKLGL
jgi:hypothetical protein